MTSQAANRIPYIPLQSEAVDFIQTGLDDFLPGFAIPPSHYASNVQTFALNGPLSDLGEGSLDAYNRAHWALSPSEAEKRVLTARPRAETSSALHFWDELFAPAMAQFVEAHPMEPAELKKKGRSIRDRSNWTSVFDQLEAAKNDYTREEKGAKATFRKVYRKAANHSAGAILSVTKTVNSAVQNDYASPVLGAIQLILEAVAKAAELRQLVTNSLDNIDGEFAQVELYLQSYNGDESIKQASIDLIASVLHAVESVAGFFISKTYKRMIKATFTIDEYSKGIKESLADIDKKSAKLIREAELSQTHRDHQFQNQVLADTAGISDIRRGQDQINRLQQIQYYYMARSVHETRNDVKALLTILLNEIDHLRSIASRPPSPAVPESVRQINAPVPATRVGPQDLLRWIGIQDLTAKDLELIEAQNHDQISEAEQGRAEQLVTNSKLKYWLSIPASSQLLIHGNFGDVRPLSGLSLFCAALALNLSEHPRLIRLLFFCGLHANEEDCDTLPAIVGGLAIIYSFICQLLCAFDFGPELPVARQSEYAVRSGNIEELCGIFVALVHRLPRSVALVCIVDGAVYYERSAFRDDALRVLARILVLSADETVPAAVKVLITSPTRTSSVCDPFPSDLILSMDAMADAEWLPSRLRMQRLLRDQAVSDDATSLPAMSWR